MAKKNKGRPTKYSPNILIDSKKYIDNCQDDFLSVVNGIDSKTGKKTFSKKWIVKLPKAEGLALYLQVSRDTLYEWALQYKEFSDILERINQIQADRVINEALAGNYNPLIAKLLLGKHGYKEDSKVEHSGSVDLLGLLKKADESKE